MHWRAAFSLFALVTLTSGCSRSNNADRVLATDIERQVATAHPDIAIERFARFYAHEQNGSVQAVYLFANEGYVPIAGKAGTSRWTTVDDLPVVYDGGCTVLNIRYDARNRKLLWVECNGDA